MLKVSSNFERFLLDIIGDDVGRCAELLQNLKSNKVFGVSAAELAKAREEFCAYSVSEEETGLL